MASEPRRPSEAERAVPARGLSSLLDGAPFAALQVAGDLFALVAATAVAALVAGRSPTGSAAWLLALTPLALALMAARGVYRPRICVSILAALRVVATAVTVATMGAVTLGVVFGAETIDPGLVIAAWAAACVAVGGSRIAALSAQRWARRVGRVCTPTLIVGAGETGARVARRLLANGCYGLRPVGFIDDLALPTRQAAGDPRLPTLGGFGDLAAVAQATGARSVVIAFSGAARDAELRPLVAQCRALGLDVLLVPRLFESINDRATYETLGGLPLIGLRTVDPKGWQFAIKHAFDTIVAAVLLLAWSPVFAAIALAVRLESPGPIVFRQRRVGRDGQVFDVLKFRSMRTGPVPDGFVPMRGSAPGGVEGADRRTRVGRFLRRTSLDELPQLINVLRGEMSLIGPRPERPEFVAQFEHSVHRYSDRHRVRSGVTGWAQVHGLRGQTSLSDRVEWDNYYIEHWSLGLDLKILLLTIVTLFHPIEQ